MDQRTRASTRDRREQGIALMISVLLLVAVSGLAISSMETAATDGTVAGFQNQDRMAFYAAESGLVQARNLIRDVGSRDEVPDYPADYPDEDAPTQLSDPADWKNGQVPEFYADPTYATPIGYAGEGGQCTEGCNMTLGGLKYNHTKWRVNVVGESPSGDLKRLEMVATRLMAVGY